MKRIHDAPGAGRRSPTNNGEAPAAGTARGFRVQSTDGTSGDYRKREATAKARAALIGLALEHVHGGGWRLSYPAFGGIGLVHALPSLQAAEATLHAFEQVRAEAQALIGRMRGGMGHA